MKELLKKITAGIDEIELRKKELEQYTEDFEDFLNKQTQINVLDSHLKDSKRPAIHLNRMEDLEKITRDISINLRDSEIFPYTAHGYIKGVKFFVLLDSTEAMEEV